LAEEMLRQTTEFGHLPYRWATGDADYGDNHDLRQAVEDLGKWYCFEVKSTAEVWAGDPNWQVPEGGKMGRPRTRKGPTAASPPALTVAQLTALLPESEWVKHRVTEGAKGPREYEFMRLRVVEKRHKKPGAWGWMMVRRPVGCPHPKEYKYYLSNAPETVTLSEMAWVGCLRWTIEENFELAKGELGLDHYDVTKFRGWYHHVTLVLMALTFLKLVERAWRKKTCPPACPRFVSCSRSCCLVSNGPPRWRSTGSTTSNGASWPQSGLIAAAGCVNIHPIQLN
jgi:SRSO17 transposase